MKSKVRWFDNDKGYGFLDYKEGEEVFIHYSSIVEPGFKTLVEGQLIHFDLLQTQKGLQAINVKYAASK